ncbi:MAG: hypothetical protein AAF431_06890 [Pseudomonadota bacterium]
MTTQNVESPKAANDFVATSVKPEGSGTKMNSEENPFSGDNAHNEVADSADSVSDSEDVDDPYIEDEQGDEGVSFRESQDSYLEWDAPSDTYYSAAELTIVGANGQKIQRTFAPGEAIVVQEQLEDGHYQWESVITPEIDPYVREEMAAVRQSGDFEAEQALIERLRSEGSLPTEEEAENNRKSGSFSVQNGVAIPIPPTHSEESPRRDSEG